MAAGDAGTAALTTSVGFGKKLERIVADPHVTLAYHTREHGFSADPRFVLAQGWATVELEPSLERLEALAPQVTRYLGEVRRGPIWDRVLREYYGDRLFVDVDVKRVVAWDNLAAVGEPAVWGIAIAEPPAPQKPPKNGTGPRSDPDTVAAQLWRLPHRLLGYRGADGYPVVVPVDVAGHHPPRGPPGAGPPAPPPRGGPARLPGPPPPPEAARLGPPP